MNRGIRLSTEFWQHPQNAQALKTPWSRRSPLSANTLVMGRAQQPDGNLSGMDWGDIELAADWKGEERAFFDHCLGVWIDEAGGGYALHDWAEHQSEVA